MAVLRLITSSYLVDACTGRSAGFSPFEDAIDVAGRTPVLVDYVRPIGDQAAAGDEVPFEVDSGQLVPGRKRDDQIAMKHRQRAPCHDQTAIRGARECRDGALDLAGVADVHRAYLHPDRRRHGLDRGELAEPGGYGGVPNDSRSRHAWRDLLEQFQPFPARAVFERGKSGGVAARAAPGYRRSRRRPDRGRTRIRSARSGSPVATALHSRCQWPE